MVERSGILVFTLWYIAIAYNYIREHRSRKDDEGTQTHTPGYVSSVALSDEGKNILDYDIEEIVSAKHGEVVVLRTPSLESVPESSTLAPEPLTKVEIEPEPAVAHEPVITYEPEVAFETEAHLEPESEGVELKSEPVSELIDIGDVFFQQADNIGSENFEEATEEEQ